MAVTKVGTTTLKDKAIKKEVYRAPLFEKDNYLWMGIGAFVIAVGMFLMSGGKSDNPAQFDYKTVYSTTRVTIAPVLIIAGLVIEIYAIFRKPKKQL